MSKKLNGTVIVTIPSTLAEMYIVNKKNALTVKKNSNGFCDLVNQVIFKDKYEYIGLNARKSFLDNFSHRSMGSKLAEFISSQSMGVR